MAEQFDVVILGGGAAGLTAGIYVSRARKSALVLDTATIGGQILLSHQVANYPGVEEVFGYQLARTMKKQAQQFGTTIVGNRELARLDLASPRKEVETSEGELFQSQAVILAVGGAPRSLGLPSEERFKGKGISYCATCDGDFYRDQDIVVVGGGNSALEEAVSLTQYAKSVTVVHQFNQFQAYQYAVDEAKQNEKIRFIMEAEVEEFLGAESLQAVRIRHKRSGQTQELQATGTFIFIGYIPNTQRLQGLVPLNAQGEILVDENMSTGIPGLFAAGDARAKRYRQITTAVSDGTIAALSALDFLHSLHRA